MSAGPAGAVVIGLGNPYRRDDGVGAAVAAALADLVPPNVAVATGITDPMGLVEAWSGVGLAVVIDAAVTGGLEPGRVRRCTLADLVAGHGTGPEGLSSHRVDVAGAFELARVLGRAPGRLVVFAIDVADTGHGVGLTHPVSRAVPDAVRLALAEIGGHPSGTP